MKERGMKEEELYKMFKTEMEEEEAEKEADIGVEEFQQTRQIDKAPPRKLKTHEPHHRIKRKVNPMDGCDS